MRKEKRSSPRFSDGVDTPVEVLLGEGAQCRAIEARLINYSTGGLHLVTKDSDLRLGMLVVVRAFNGRPMLADELEGKIVWVTEKKGTVRFGLEYTEPMLKIPSFFYGEA